MSLREFTHDFIHAAGLIFSSVLMYRLKHQKGPLIVINPSTNMNTKQNFFQRMFSSSSLIHGALMAMLTAIWAILQPVIQQIQQTGSIPSWTVLAPILLHALYAGITAFIIYLLKNGLFGNSQITQAPAPQPPAK